MGFTHFTEVFIKIDHLKEFMCSMGELQQEGLRLSNEDKANKHNAAASDQKELLHFYRVNMPQ